MTQAFWTRHLPQSMHSWQGPHSSAVHPTTTMVSPFSVSSPAKIAEDAEAGQDQIKRRQLSLRGPAHNRYIRVGGQSTYLEHLIWSRVLAHIRSLSKILETTTDADASTLAISNQPRGNETLVSTLKGRNLANLGLKCAPLLHITISSSDSSFCLQSRGSCFCHIPATSLCQYLP